MPDDTAGEKRRTRRRRWVGIATSIAATLLVVAIGSAQDPEDGPYMSVGDLSLSEFTEWQVEFTVAMNKVECPSTLPSVGFENVAYAGYRVKKWNMPDSAGKIRFWAQARTLDGSMPTTTLGSGYYNVLPDIAYDDGERWMWESNEASNKGATFATCFQLSVTYGRFRIGIKDKVILTGEPLIGFAMPFHDENERDVGGGSEGCGSGEILMESYEWWYDQFNNYHENHISYFCVEVWVT